MGYFPKIWKVAVIRVIPKPQKEDYSAPKSYRPIGLLPVFGKILEKLFTTRLMWHLGSLELLSRRQYGFMPQVSTEDALYDAVNLIRREVTAKKIVAVVSLDIQGAFDGAWWPLIKHQLITKNCPENILLLVDSYLSERSVCVQYAGQEIHKITMKGCIQGSTCGPVMWNLQLDPILQEAEKIDAHIQAFADDILIIASAKTTTEINRYVNSALEIVSDWGQKSKMKFAAHKTQAIVVTRKLKYDTPRFVLNGVDLEITNELKVLGLTLDSKLMLRTHLQNVCRKAVNIFQKVSTATRANWGLNPKITRLLYIAVVEPIILYAASVWGPITDKLYVITRLNQISRKFGIMVAKAHRTASLTSVLCLAGLFPLDLRVKESAELYELKRGKPIPELPGRKVERRIGVFKLPHPAKRLPIHFELLKTEQDINNISTYPNIYTDGSKIQVKVGAAATWWGDGKEVRCSNFILAPYCSVYQAELAAILRGLEMMSKTRNATVNILSDSRSSPNNTHPIVVEIQTKVQELETKERQVRFYWIKAHEGFAGNERADELAKAAALTKKTSPVYDRVPVSYIKYSLRQKTIDLWNARYMEADTGKIAKLFFPNVRTGHKTI